MCESILNVAKCILDKLGYVSTMKLQKLAFYSQAYALVTTGAPLFDDDFEAWKNGPVSPRLYSYHRHRYIIGSEDLHVDAVRPYVESASEEIINTVLNAIGSYDGNQLSSLTHNEQPWISARGTCAPGASCSTVISKGSIRDFYSRSVPGNPLFSD